MDVSGRLQAPAALPQRESPYYPLYRWLGVLQIQSGRSGEEKNFQLMPGLEPPIIQPVASLYIIVI
jgi:hypothetical protein